MESRLYDQIAPGFATGIDEMKDNARHLGKLDVIEVVYPILGQALREGWMVNHLIDALFNRLEQFRE